MARRSCLNGPQWFTQDANTKDEMLELSLSTIAAITNSNGNIEPFPVNNSNNEERRFEEKGLLSYHRRGVMTMSLRFLAQEIIAGLRCLGSDSGFSKNPGFHEASRRPDINVLWQTWHVPKTGTMWKVPPPPGKVLCSPVSLNAGCDARQWFGSVRSSLQQIAFERERTTGTDRRLAAGGCPQNTAVEPRTLRTRSWNIPGGSDVLCCYRMFEVLTRGDVILRWNWSSGFKVLTNRSEEISFYNIKKNGFKYVFIKSFGKKVRKKSSREPDWPLLTLLSCWRFRLELS